MEDQSTGLPGGLDPHALRRSVAGALEEDLGTGDLTAGLIDEGVVGRAEVRARERCILCGTAWFTEVFRQLCARATVQWHHADGDRVAAGAVVCTLRGSARALLSGERTALNFLQLLSATATRTRTYVQAAQGTRAKILDTRKTIPGLRAAQKYAVRCGGGENHRQGLYDAILIKENHIAAAGSLAAAVAAGRSRDPHVMLEVEVETSEELREALGCGADRIMLDNFTVSQISAAVIERDARAPGVELEASGGINLDEIRAIGETGVDFISVGALTKHARAIDFSMRLL